MEITAGGELLGWTFGDEAPAMRVSPGRAWKLRLGIEALLDRGTCSGDELRAVIGACTFAALVRRESLSVFSAVYAYMNHFWAKACSHLDSCAPRVALVCRAGAPARPTT